MTKVYFCLFLFLLLVPPVQAWDFCVPNEDGVMLYYNIVSEDEQSCEVAYCHHASYICDILTIPEMVILNRGNRDFGDPDTLMKVIGIGDWAFRYYCDPDGVEPYNLHSDFNIIKLPYGLSYIGESAFRGSGVQQIVWPENNEWFYSIGECAFFMSALKSIKIPKTTEEIGPSAFDTCVILSQVEFEEGNEKLTYLPEKCFYRCPALKEVRLCSSIAEIGNRAFMYCRNLSTVKFAEGLKTIGEYAFSQCIRLDAPRLPDGLQFLKTSAFGGHRTWQSLELPETIWDIGEYALSSDRGLRIINLYVRKKTAPYCVSPYSLGTYLWDDKTRNYTDTRITETKLYVPIGCIDEYATTYPWNRFVFIAAYDPAGIEQVRISKPQPEGVFSLDGRRLTKTQKGLNIIRYKDGTAKKIVVK